MSKAQVRQNARDWANEATTGKEAAVTLAAAVGTPRFRDKLMAAIEAGTDEAVIDGIEKEDDYYHNWLPTEDKFGSPRNDGTTDFTDRRTNPYFEMGMAIAGSFDEDDHMAYTRVRSGAQRDAFGVDFLEE